MCLAPTERDKLKSLKSIQKKNADFKRFFFLLKAIYCTVFQFKLYLFLN
ncbi:hypothetical protein SMU69_01107 [Streptococcus mutans NLML4]|nr:hypothetical protein SMU69_01107 [Streptococcus mutans NLML4]